jgi:small subunit ribosomal protein S21
MRKNHNKFYNDRKKEQKEKPFGLQVAVFDNNVEQALRKLKKKVSNAGLLQEVKKREYYEKPTQKRKLKKAMAVKREQKRMAQVVLPAKRGYNKS